MMHKKLHRIAVFLITAVLAIGMACPVFAADASAVPELSRDGSLQVTMKLDNKAVSGGELTAYQVADVALDDGDLSYEYTNGFENCGIDLGDLSDKTLADKLSKVVASDAGKVTQSVASDGTVKFSNLKLGLYLVLQTKSGTGYKDISAFLVSVPMQEDGAWVYNVDATPKIGTLTADTPTPGKPNTPKVTTLPQTGQLNWPVPVLAVAGLLIFALGWSMRRGRRVHEA